MRPALLFEAGPLIAGHAIAAIAALLLGGVQIAMPKGTRAHRAMGWSWVGLMASVALSGFWISELRLFGRFSPIHALSIVTLVTLWSAVAAARRGDVEAHKRRLTLLYGLGLILTGAFTLAPGRVMHAVVFGP